MLLFVLYLHLFIYPWQSLLIFQFLESELCKCMFYTKVTLILCTFWGLFFAFQVVFFKED